MGTKEEMRDEMLAFLVKTMRAQGVSIKKIAEELDITQAKVRELCKKS